MGKDVVPKGAARADRSNGAGVGLLRGNPERGGFFLLFILLALVPLALLGLGPGAGVAQEQQGGRRVTGEGQAAFPSAADPDGLPGCRFLVDASQDDSGPSGSFTCELSDEAIARGFPFTKIEAQVTKVEAPSQDDATIEGSAVVELTDGGPIEDVPTLIGVHAGGPGVGELRIFLEGVLDGRIGDETPGDGDYSLFPQEVTEGSIEILLEGPGPSPSPSTSPTESPGPSPTPTPTPGVSPSPTPTPTASPNPSPTFSSPSSGPPSPGPTGPLPSPSIKDAPFVVAGTESTARLMAILAELSPNGTPDQGDILAVVGPFPVAGLAWWQNDWHAYRCCPFPHIHQGLDVFAPRGTPVVAAADGHVSQKLDGPISGLAVEITDVGNTQYFYAHLSGFASGIAAGTRVHAGQVLGYIGNTGNASRTLPHLHFEIQPGGIPVPPMPIVDRWLRLAEERARSLVERRIGRTILDPASLPLWIRRAQELGGGDAAREIGDEATLRRLGSHRSAAADQHPAGPLVAFAAGALLILLVFPAVMVGIKDARKGWEQGGGRLPPEPAGWPGRSGRSGPPTGERDRSPGRDPRAGSPGRQRPAAR
jgi:murein DD-endopeptidase MepM/ murein hydrolase activator NlpD